MHQKQKRVRIDKVTQERTWSGNAKQTKRWTSEQKAQWTDQPDDNRFTCRCPGSMQYMWSVGGIDGRNISVVELG